MKVNMKINIKQRIDKKMVQKNKKYRKERKKIQYENYTSRMHKNRKREQKLIKTIFSLQIKYYEKKTNNNF